MKEIRRILLLIGVSSEYERGLLSGIAKYSEVYGPWSFYRAAPFSYEEHPYSRRMMEKRVLDHFVKWQPDGIIALAPERLITQITSIGVPIIAATAVDRSSIPDIPVISADYLATGEMAAEHLLSRGFRSFAYCGAGDISWARQRGEGFAHRISAAGFDTHIYQPPQRKRDRFWGHEQQVMVDWLGSLPKPIGLMTCNDNRSQQVIEACKVAEIKVPEEIAVLGVDNDKFVCDLASPSLSSIELDTEGAGFKAAQLLDQLIAGALPEIDTITINPVRVVTRRSTDILAIEDPEVAEAVRFINEHFKDNIQVDDVVAATYTSRRTLERRFRETLGYSIKQEIKRIRVDQIVQMLLNTNMTVAEISSALGYLGTDHFSRYFRQIKGMSPVAFRLKHKKQ